ncbi:MAG: lytic transglycosylase domain-containing protein [Clostridiales bacterium]|nr:lytic transglycosylase domain-containing protein [Clostridiales bacterium]
MQSIQKKNGDIEQTNQVTSLRQRKNITSFEQVLKEKSSGTGKGTLDDYFQEASETYGVPLSLLKAVAKAESDFNPNVVSSAGAVGIMQLMPATAKELGVQNIYDVKENIMGGAKELSGLLKRYHGDLTLTLAGYNAGIGNVQKYGGVPPFQETQNYIKKITSYLGEEIEIPTSRNQVNVEYVEQESQVLEGNPLTVEEQNQFGEKTSLWEKELFQYYVETMKYQIQASFYQTISLTEEESL